VIDINAVIRIESEGNMKKKKPCVVTGEVDFGEEIYICYPGATGFIVLLLVASAMMIYWIVLGILNESVSPGIFLVIFFTAGFFNTLDLVFLKVTVYQEGLRVESFIRNKAIMFKAVDNMMAQPDRGRVSWVWVLHIRKDYGKRFAVIYGARDELERIEASYLRWRNTK